MFKTNVVALASVCLALSGCATASKDIAATYISPMQYASYDCDQLNAEASRIQSRVVALGGRLDQAAQNDAALVAVGVILFWPALFALGGTKQQEAEFARLKGEYDALQHAAVQKKCVTGLQAQPAGPSMPAQVALAPVAEPQGGPRGASPPISQPVAAPAPTPLVQPAAMNVAPAVEPQVGPRGAPLPISQPATVPVPTPVVQPAAMSVAPPLAVTAPSPPVNQAATSVSNPASPTQQPPLPQAAASAPRYLPMAEKFARDVGCAEPRVSMASSTQLYETFTAICTAGEPRTIRCHSAACRELM